MSQGFFHNFWNYFRFFYPNGSQNLDGQDNYQYFPNQHIPNLQQKNENVKAFFQKY